MITQTSQMRWLALLGILGVVVLLTTIFHSSRTIAWTGWTRPNMPLNGVPEFSPSSSLPTCPPAKEPEAVHILPVEEKEEEWDPARYLKGGPTWNIKDNLVDDVHYITSWASSGFTNQFIGYINLIYLGILSDRVPIIPPFAPNKHITDDAGVLPFGQVFNMSEARRALRKPLLEWSDLKDFPNGTSVAPPPSSEREQLGCWSTRPEGNPHPYRPTALVDNLRLDLAYTGMPREAKARPNEPKEDFMDLTHMVPFIFPNHPWRRPSSLPLMEKSPLGHSLPPDEQLACLDNSYYLTSSYDLFDWEREWSPVWRFVGRHLQFTDHLKGLAKEYLARSFQTSEANIPPYIAVHIRRGDFADPCRDKGAKAECLKPLDKFKAQVDKIREDLRIKKNLDVTEVILMSDEKDPKFWEDAAAIGWRNIDHSKEASLDKHGEWIPPIIDQVIQSMAFGLVGTKPSTFSLMGTKRVQDWNEGLGIMLSR